MQGDFRFNSFMVCMIGQVIFKFFHPPNVGMWQLSGAHGYKPNVDASLSDMKSLVDAGFVSFDLADHYGPYTNSFSPFVLCSFDNRSQVLQRIMWGHFGSNIQSLLPVAISPFSPNGYHALARCLSPSWSRPSPSPEGPPLFLRARCVGVDCAAKISTFSSCSRASVASPVLNLWRPLPAFNSLEAAGGCEQRLWIWCRCGSTFERCLGTGDITCARAHTHTHTHTHHTSHTYTHKLRLLRE